MKVGKYNCEVYEKDGKYVVSFVDDYNIEHRLIVEDISENSILDSINKYLYGYEIDGVRIPGYYDIYKNKLR